MLYRSGVVINNLKPNGSLINLFIFIWHDEETGNQPKLKLQPTDYSAKMSVSTSPTSSDGSHSSLTYCKGAQDNQLMASSLLPLNPHKPTT